MGQLVFDQLTFLRYVNEVVATPFVIPGLTLKTIDELLTFNMYHEGVHVQAIRMLKKLI